MERIPDNPELDTEIAAYWKKYFQESKGFLTMQKYFITDNDDSIMIHDLINTDTITINHSDIPYLIIELEKRRISE